ncbi:MAG TPA: cytochrome c biogenesis protein ResB [Actinomycetes bacterium]
MADTTLTTAPPSEQEPPGGPVGLRPGELARWTWRQLTSMRTALVLLFLLTLAAVPGSLVPQEGVDPVRVAQFKQQHPGLTQWYEPLSLFHVYSAPWFAAIYLLLFVSLAGCVLPRTRAHWAAMRARPPAAPRNLTRLPVAESWTTEARPEAVLAQAREVLRRRRFRVDATPTAVSAEAGYLRETGNLVFHVALLLLLVAVAVGNLFGFKGSVLVTEGAGFSNTVSAYDTFRRGPSFDEGSLAPFSVTLDKLSVRYQHAGTQKGAPRDFQARLTYTPTPTAAERRYDLRVNHPLVVDGTKVFLLGNGYAPVFTVRDGTGEVVFSGPVPFLPRDGNNTSTGVVKVSGAQPTQLGFEGLFLPTAMIDPQRGPVSVYPDLTLPRAVLNAWSGDLGLDSGAAQSVYRLDTSRMKQVTRDGRPLAQALAPGATMTLPDGLGSITFDGVRRWATLQVAHDPGKEPALAAAALALAGLMLSLFVRRRRIWVRVGDDGAGRTLVEVAGLSRSEGDGLADEVGLVVTALREGAAPGPAGPDVHEED